jgi:hypothetical protein
MSDGLKPRAGPPPPNRYFFDEHGERLVPPPDEERKRFGDPTCGHLYRCWFSKKCAACGWEPA